MSIASAIKKAHAQLQNKTAKAAIEDDTQHITLIVEKPLWTIIKRKARKQMVLPHDYMLYLIEKGVSEQ